MQAKLFYEDEFEALAMMISNSSKSTKEVAAFLFPDRKLDSAYARLKACLNPEKDERVKVAQAFKEATIMMNQALAAMQRLGQG